VDPKSRLTIAATVAWRGSIVDDHECRDAIRRQFGDAFAASVLVIPVARVPLTEQGKPDRTAVLRLTQQALAARSQLPAPEGGDVMIDGWGTCSVPGAISRSAVYAAPALTTAPSTTELTEI
jgi:hypothetical protein